MANITTTQGIKLNTKTAVSFFKPDRSPKDRRQENSPNKSFYSKSGLQECDRVTVNRSSLLNLQNSGASLPALNPPNLTLALQSIGNQTKKVVIQVGTPQEAIRIKRRLMTNDSMISGATSSSNRHNRSHSVQQFVRDSERQDFFTKRRSVQKYDDSSLVGGGDYGTSSASKTHFQTATPQKLRVTEDFLNKIQNLTSQRDAQVSASGVMMNSLARKMAQYQEQYRIEVVSKQSEKKLRPKDEPIQPKTASQDKQTFSSLLQRLPENQGSVFDFSTSINVQEQQLQNDQDEKYSVNDVVMLSKPVKRSNFEALSILQVYENSLNKSTKVTQSKKSGEIIKKTSRDIKIMQYQLERIFQQGVSGYLRFAAGQKYEIDAEPDQPVMAYMPLDPGLSPIFFSITPNVNPKAKFDLKVYMSMKNKDPTDRSNDKSCLNKLKFGFNPKEFLWQSLDPTHKRQNSSQGKNSSQAPPQFLYLSFSSFLGISFTVKVVQLVTQPGSKKNKKGFQVAESEGVNGELNEYWRKVLDEEFSINYDKNFIKQNQFSIKERLAKKMYDLQVHNHQKAERSLQVTEQKEEKEKEQREKILAQILKWQIIKENRARDAKAKEQEARAKAVLNLVNLRRIVNLLAVKLRSQKMAYKFQARIYHLCRCFFVKGQYLISKRGKTRETRSLAELRRSFAYAGGIAQRETHMSRAGSLMAQFLADIDSINYLRRQMMEFRRNIVLIQRQIRMKRLLDKHRMFDLLYIWEVVKSDLIKILGTQHKGHEGAKKISAKIAATSKEVQNKFVEIFIDYTQSIFTSQYYEWRIKHIARQRMSSQYDFGDKIEYFNSKTKQYNQILFKDLKPQAVSLLNKINPQSRTRLYYGNVKILEDMKKSPRGESESDDQSEIPRLPVYMFLPSKSEIMRMILKAAFTEMKGIETIQTIKIIQSIGAVPTPSQMDEDKPTITGLPTPMSPE